jgi:hypothetical protein
MNNLMTVIDFSANDLRVVTGYYYKGNVYVLQALQGDTLPRDKDGFLEKEATETSLRLLLDTVKASLKNDAQHNPSLGAFIVLLAPVGFVLRSGIGRTETVDQHSRIAQIDFANGANMIHKQVKEDGKKILFDEPSLFIDDSRKNYETFPLGSLSDQLEIHADCQMIDEAYFDHYETILKDLKLDPYLTLLAPFAATSFFNHLGTPDAYLALDLEKDTSLLSFVQDHRLADSRVVPFGLSQGTQLASTSLGIDLSHVEELIRLFGLREDSGFGFRTDDRKTLQETSQALKNGFAPLVSAIKDFLVQHPLSPESPLILYGLGSDIEDLDTYFALALGRPAQVFTSHVIGARSKVFANALGALFAPSLNYLPKIPDPGEKANDPLAESDVLSRMK